MYIWSDIPVGSVGSVPTQPLHKCEGECLPVSKQPFTPMQFWSFKWFLTCTLLYGDIFRLRTGKRSGLRFGCSTSGCVADERGVTGGAAVLWNLILNKKLKTKKNQKLCFEVWQRCSKTHTEEHSSLVKCSPVLVAHQSDLNKLDSRH